MTQDTAVQIYLAVEAGGAPAAALAATMTGLLETATGRKLISAVLIMPPPGKDLDAGIAPLVEAAQKRDVAVLLYADAHLTRTLRADGVHLPPSEQPMAAFAEARDILGTRAMIGADAGFMRHDAMELGEAGAAYIAFGLLPGIDREDAAARREDLVSWWSEIFEVPCVAMNIDDPDEAAALAAAGADFVALKLPPDMAGEAAEQWLTDHASRLARRAAAA